MNFINHHHLKKELIYFKNGIILEYNANLYSTIDVIFTQWPNEDEDEDEDEDDLIQGGRMKEGMWCG